MRQAFFHGVMPCEIARIPYRPPRDADGRQAHTDAQSGQPFQTGIGGNVVALSGVAQSGADGRVQNKMRERQALRRFMQMPRSGELGSQHSSKALRVDVRQQAVIKNRRRMYHPLERRHGYADTVDEAAHGLGVRHVAGFSPDVDPARSEGV